MVGMTEKAGFKSLSGRSWRQHFESDRNMPWSFASLPAMNKWLSPTSDEVEITESFEFVTHQICNKSIWCGATNRRGMVDPHRHTGFPVSYNFSKGIKMV